MIGPGTGLAPFRGFIQERMWSKQQGFLLLRILSFVTVCYIRVGLNVGRTVFFFGCRNRNEDFLYKNDILQWEKEGLELFTSFSREKVIGILMTRYFC
jgi:NADPH-ferrihemoprotein reductase